jgi:hypothetical protein
VNGDGRPDMLFVWNSYSPQWRAPGADPTVAWPVGAMLQNVQTQGGAIGDLDGDKDNDIVVGNQWWYRNMDGKGTQWETVRSTPAGAFDDSPPVNIGDIDGDGDMDPGGCTHFAPRGSRTAAARRRLTLHVLASNRTSCTRSSPSTSTTTATRHLRRRRGDRPDLGEHRRQGRVQGHAAAMNAARPRRAWVVDCDGDLTSRASPGRSDHVYPQNMTVGGAARPSSSVRGRGLAPARSPTTVRRPPPVTPRRTRHRP